MSGPVFGSMSSQAHQAHIALSGPMTNIVQQGSNLGSYSTFSSPNPYYNSTFGSVTLCQVLSDGRPRQIAHSGWNNRWARKVICTSSSHSTSTKALSVAAARDAQLLAYPTADVLIPANRRRRNRPQPRTQHR